MTAIGIDFGTTNSVVATWSGSAPEVLAIDEPLGEWQALGFDKVMPSVYAKSPDGGALFGWAAKAMTRNKFQAVKRLFAAQQDVVTDDDGEVFLVEEVATLLFAKLRANTLGQGVEAQQAVVTIPANSRGLARHRTKLCAGMGGVEVLALINEPTAAAMSHALHHGGDQQVLVFDWGGGTLDVTVLRSVGGVFMEQASMGLPTRGGIDFDTRLSAVVRELSGGDADGWSAADRARMALEIEMAKIRLSSREQTVLQLPGGTTATVERHAFERAIQPLIEESRGPLERCLRDVGAVRGSMDAVVMVGGTSKIPAVRSFVADVVGVQPTASIDPMTAVGEGAAVAAAILTGRATDLDFFVATEHALGTVVHESRQGPGRFGVLIPRNHKLPARRSDVYGPLYAEQEDVELQVVEGNPDVPLDDPDTVVLKTWVVPVPGNVGDPDRTFTMEYDYNVDGILHVRVVANASGQEILTDTVSYGATQDPRSRVRIAKSAAETVATGTAASPILPSDADPETVALLERARVKVIPFLDDDDAVELMGLADALARDPDDERLAGQLADSLRTYSYLL